MSPVGCDTQSPWRVSLVSWRDQHWGSALLPVPGGWVGGQLCPQLAGSRLGGESQGLSCVPGRRRRWPHCGVRQLFSQTFAAVSCLAMLPSGLGLPTAVYPRYDGHQKVSSRNLFCLPLLLKHPWGSPSIAAAPGCCSLAAARPSRVPAAVRPTGGRGPAGSVEPGSAGDFTVPPPSAVNSSWTAAEETSGLGFSSICKNALLHFPNA